MLSQRAVSRMSGWMPISRTLHGVLRRLFYFACAMMKLDERMRR
jgi:hypothetical protein